MELEQTGHDDAPADDVDDDDDDDNDDAGDDDDDDVGDGRERCLAGRARSGTARTADMEIRALRCRLLVSVGRV